MGTCEGLCYACYSTFNFSFSKNTLDVVDSSLWSDLSNDAQEFEAESWSLVVDPSFCSRQEKDVIKRQDVIFGKLFRDDRQGEALWYKGKSLEFETIPTWVQIQLLLFSSYLISEKLLTHLDFNFSICKMGNNDTQV